MKQLESRRHPIGNRARFSHPALADGLSHCRHVSYLVLFSVLIVSVLCFTINVSAEGVKIKYYGIEMSIREDLSIDNTITFKFKTPISHLDYQPDFRMHDLNVSTNFGPIDCRTFESGESTRISCDLMGIITEDNYIRFDFRTKEGVKRVGNKHEFMVSYGISHETERVFASIKLPERAVLAAEGNESYFPRDAKVITDGRRIITIWERLNLTQGANLDFSVLYEMPGTRGEIDNLLISVLTVIIVAAMLGIAVYVRRGYKRPAGTVKVVAPLLRDDERAIISILTKHGGKAMQRVLVRESDFSKAKVSRLVKSLKERKVLDVEPLGRTNRITLKIKGEGQTEPGKEE